MDYFTNGQAVEYVMGETWTWDGDPEHAPTAYDVTYARQFRYDGARQRYMNRKLNLTDYSDDGTTWSDYDGDYVYGDYTISGAMPGVTITEERSFELGVGVVEDPAGTPTKEFFHPDLIGTTRHMTDVTGAKTASVVYTAFGERITGTNHRYGYAGAWGYQTDDSAAPTFPFLHVGHRYYDPATGRFLQRDPIGIRGGTNVYVYVRSEPTQYSDPSGLEGGIDPFGVRSGYEKRLPPPPPKEMTSQTIPQMRAELERTKKGIWAVDAICGGAWALGNPLLFIGATLAHLIDEWLLHPGEPLNPALGGDYSNE
jgi:RHS repeat-associated protein